jgi:hypothetical protein
MYLYIRQINKAKFSTSSSLIILYISEIYTQGLNPQSYIKNRTHRSGAAYIIIESSASNAVINYVFTRVADSAAKTSG